MNVLAVPVAHLEDGGRPSQTMQPGKVDSMTDELVDWSPPRPSADDEPQIGSPLDLASFGA